MIETTPAAPHDAAPSRTNGETQQLVLQIVAREAESLLRVARRHSLCADDAHDAYQRSMEILVRRAPTLDPASAARWVHVVVKHEAMALRKRRSDVVSPEDVDFERHEAIHSPSPEEQAIGADRTARAAEALQRLKPHELRAMWLKALGKSYAEICDETGWSHTKLNRCLAEGRKTFLQRYAGIEAGEECARWQPALSALVDGEADAAAIAELRPHLRNCSACRAALRALREARAPLAAVLPVGVLGAGATLSGLLERALPAASNGEAVALAGSGARLGGIFERVLPAASGSDAALASGGGGVLGVGGTKLVGLVAAGAAATAGGGGLVVAHEHRDAKPVRPDVLAEARHADIAAVPVAQRLAEAGSAAPRGAERPQDVASRHDVEAAARARRRADRRARLRLAARRRADGRIEFAPAGGEAAPAATAPTAATLSQASVASTPPASSAPAAPQPVAPPPSAPDSSSGEFAPAP